MKRLQHKIAVSRWALPVTAIYGLLLCLASGMASESLWLNFCLLLVSTVMMAELNNMNSLIRIYSRMVSCSFLIMTTMSIFLFKSLEVDAVQLTFIAFLLFILRAYQDQNATGLTYYAFIALGISSIVFPQVLLFVPVLWIVMAVYVMCFSPRTFFSSLLGIITPYWFVVAWLLYKGDMSWLGAHFLSIVQFSMPFDLTIIGTHQWITFAFLVVVAAIGSVHFIMYSYKDRIRIRMIYEMFILLDAICLIFALVQPQHFNDLLGMGIVLTAPLIGHWLALTESRLSNVCSMVLFLSAMAITVYNLIIG